MWKKGISKVGKKKQFVFRILVKLYKEIPQQEEIGYEQQDEEMNRKTKKKTDQNFDDKEEEKEKNGTRI